MQGARQGWRKAWSRKGGEEEVRVLARDQVTRLPGWREGSSVRVAAGVVVVTREGDAEDHVLEAGARLLVPGRGLAVAWAMEPSTIEVRRGGTERAGERPAAVARLSVAR
jgi:hypothetical protein